MSNKRKTPSADENDERAYRAAGIGFLIAGIILIVSENTRTTGVPFIVLGITFSVLAQQGSGKSKK